VVELMCVDLPIPDYTTVSRRQAGLARELAPSRTRTPRHVVIDSTGLKVFGAGEWYVRKHGMGRGRRRIWRKLHLGVDEASKEIAAVDLTTRMAFISLAFLLLLIPCRLHRRSSSRYSKLVV
jgi:hypothetical protein